MMEELLIEKLALLRRLNKLTDRVADEAYRQQSRFAIDADFEAFDVKVALDTVGKRLDALQSKQRRRQKQR